ncbi:AbrB family transcriptional regulator [Litorivita sp. NS0012-18]|uniref:AbrB family transcriptional regulator n=1 Tax=Litorivita sp. NS0012-18 TaxID=3127655 RepID=UPI003104083F
MRSIRLFGEDIHIGMTLAIFAAGIIGGLVATVIGSPLPMLLGSLTFVGALAIFGFAPGGQPPKVPIWLRLLFIPIIGLSIGATFTPEVFSEMRKWWPSLLALTLYIPLTHYFGYIGYRRVGKISGSTAYYAAVPGGLLECIAMGEEAGADVRMLMALQFLRLILTIMLVPLAFSVVSGNPVGSAGGMQIATAAAPFTGAEVALQAMTAAFGALIGKRLKFPAYIITGPILFSGIGHLTGIIQSAPPVWLISITQLIIGVSLGTRFVGMQLRAFFKALWLALINILATMVIAMAMGLLLHQLVGERVEAVVLAFAPGGLAEMSLVALSLHISVVYVTAHHVLRIILSVSVAKMFAHRVPPDNLAQREGAKPPAP